MITAQPQSLNELLDYFSDVPAKMQSFYRGLFEKLGITEGKNYVEEVVDQLHRRGENLLALMIMDRLRVGFEVPTQSTPVNYDLLIVKIKVLHALHNYTEARHLAESLKAVLPSPDIELIGNLASIVKSQALATSVIEQRCAWMKESMELYGSVFTEPTFHGSYWLGVNALSLAICLGEFEWVRNHLPSVIEDCEASFGESKHADFWSAATLAELQLIAYLASHDRANSDRKNVITLYKQVDKICQTLQQRKSARKNMVMMLEHVAVDEAQFSALLQDELNAALRPARVIIFTGHRVDDANRTEPRFTPSQVPKFSDALNLLLDEEPIDVGFSSAANGGDLLFVETLLKRGVPSHVILPFNEQQFRSQSVISNNAEDYYDWGKSFDSVCQGQRDGAVIWHASQSTVDDEVADEYYAHANQVILGMGRLKAKELGGELRGLALLSEEGQHSEVGSQAAVAEWSAREIPMKVFNPNTNYWRTIEPLSSASEETDLPERSVVNRTMLFADVMGFSKFGEPAMAGFCSGFLQAVRDLVDTVEISPEEINTWGDGLFLVFPTASAGADFALRLCELMKVRNQDDGWTAFGLPQQMHVRVSLHSSPVRRFENPLTQVTSHWGHNVNVAARIEPITPPDQVYASASTAALIAAENTDHFAADFVGLVPLAKNFGSLEIFRIRRLGHL